ncbi:MAG: c-type cytochrome [Opitutales bacterium]|nr:c-type cytochrome [Opitutales bacterium]
MSRCFLIRSFLNSFTLTGFANIAFAGFFDEFSVQYGWSLSVNEPIVEIRWLARAGVDYQAETSDTLSHPGSWTETGPVITGSGAMESLILPLSSDPLFLRLIYKVEEFDENYQIVPLYTAETLRQPDYRIETDEALITFIGDRARDRHAREGTGTVAVNNFDAYDHFLPFYWEERTLGVEIIDRVAKGGTTITYNYSTDIPLSAPEFRVFFRGLGTVAEYHYNALAPLVDPATNTYSVTIDRNHQFNRSLQIGDRIEMEISLFLSGPSNGRTNYYGTTLLYIVGRGIVPWQTAETAGLPHNPNHQGERLDSFPIPEEGWIGGETTLPYRYTLEPEHLFKQFAGNAAPQSAKDFLLGRRIHHTDFGSGQHSEPGNPVFLTHANKLGPLYNGRSCVDCHTNNGRSMPPAVEMPISLAVINVGADATGAPHPQFGKAIQTRAISGHEPEATVTISEYTYIDGTYGDGTPYELRRPIYRFDGADPEFHSVRMARPLVGLGLLEAIDEAEILKLADPNDETGNGISGRPQIVTDPETGDTRLGRFGHKAATVSLRHQIASAFKNDMGVSSTIFPSMDGSEPNLSDEDIDQLVLYVAVLGVNARRDLNNPQTILGHQLMETAGCTNCHARNLKTGSNHPSAELRNQTIHPYSDLLLHDMGSDLADNLGEGLASGSEWRTAPLWSIGLTAAVNAGNESYLHDGRARTLEEAILWHGGEAEQAKENFRTMSAEERDAIVAYLKSL